MGNEQEIKTLCLLVTLCFSSFGYTQTDELPEKEKKMSYGINGLMVFIPEVNHFTSGDIANNSGMSYGSGISLNYMINKNFSLSPAMDFNIGEFDRILASNDNLYAQYAHRYTQFKIPIRLLYNVCPKNRLQYSAGFGTSIDFFYNESRKNGVYLFDKDKLYNKYWQISFLSSVSATYF